MSRAPPEITVTVNVIEVLLPSRSEIRPKEVPTDRSGDETHGGPADVPRLAPGWSSVLEMLSPVAVDRGDLAAAKDGFLSGC